MTDRSLFFSLSLSLSLSLSAIRPIFQGADIARSDEEIGAAKI
jgi:hypothetical protein